MRQLASIQKILSLTPIEGADFIEKAEVLGWDLVVKKGEFAVGDLCVYFEIDSVLPDNEAFAFLKRTPDDTKGLRLKTKRMKGILSQGLALPLKVMANFSERSLDSFQEEEEVTEIIGVEKYEAPLRYSGPPNKRVRMRTFPSFLPKTDETRIQSVLKVLDELEGLPYVITLKLDGSSFTAYNYDGKYGVCSRNMEIDDLNEEENFFIKAAKKYNLQEVLPAAGEYAIQGELVGPGVQKNRLQLEEHDMLVFNVYDIRNRKYLDFAEQKTFCEENGLKMVPVVEIGKSFKHTKTSLLELAEGKYEGTKNEREGIVIRPQKEMYSLRLKGRLSFKAISNKFLLKTSDQDK